MTLLNASRFNSVSDLARYIEDSMGSEGAREVAEALAEVVWEDGGRTVERLTARWPDDDSFFAEWHKVEESRNEP